VIERALELARGCVPWLELAVDVRNTPAVRLYEAAGFITRGRRAVHLVIFPATSTLP
jgi:ribosomal protein S18 acetylase RimI-like enzyme